MKGFQRSDHDSHVYSKVMDSGNIVYLLLYVNDMLVAGKSKTEIKEVKDRLKGELPVLTPLA